MANKRPIGLKAQKQQQTHKKLRTAQTDDHQASFKTVALVTANGDQAAQKNGQAQEQEQEQEHEHEQEQDGLTVADLLQLKRQADELVNSPTGLPADDEHLASLLRGICHEAVRQVELAEGQETSGSLAALTHDLLAWATLELAILLSHPPQAARLLLPDEPQGLDSWLALAAKALDIRPAGTASTHLPPSDLALLPFALALLRAACPSEISDAVKVLSCQLSTQTSLDALRTIYVLRTIDRLLLLRSHIFSQNPTPIFNSLVGCLKTLRAQAETDQKPAELCQQIDLRLADCYLSHASLLAEQIEERYYSDVGPSEAGETDEFPVDPEDPTYSLALQTLRSAEEMIVGLLSTVDETEAEVKESLKSKLDEALLTLGNLLPPGPEREALYLRAGLTQDEPDER